ncbi:hypothetical protein BASA81_002556 [Batrachochytrium salamandrivorans]|nr:hypothetical protein BASA81_002556 [Batrachochytrium salamandrivorans]
MANSSSTPTRYVVVVLALYLALSLATWDGHDLLDVAVSLCVYLTGGPFHLFQQGHPLLPVTLFLKRWGEPCLTYPPRLGLNERFHFADQPDLAPFHIVTPEGLLPNETRPVLFFFHKGGFVVGHANERDWTPKFVSRGVIVVSIDYPLSPESVFPSAFDLSRNTVLYLCNHPWLVKHGDFSKVGIGGYSAGGNLAATVTRAVAPLLAPKLKVHLVASGTLQSHDFQDPSVYDQFPSLKLHQHDPSCSLKDLEWFWTMYCAQQAECRRDGRASPLGFASTVQVPGVVYVGNRDVLYNENVQYSAQLGGRSKLVCSMTIV